MINIEIKKYSLALYKVAVQKNELDNVANSINQFREIFSVYNSILKDQLHFLKKKKQLEIINIMFKEGNFNKLLFNFVIVLVESGKINLLEGFLKHWNELLQEFKGYQKIIVITADPLSKEQEEAINLKLTNYLRSSFFIEKKIDKKIIAGLIIRGQNFEFNDSILTKLNNISKNIKGALLNE